MALTPKQERFVQEYLVDQNATQAAIRAKYSEATAMEQGSRLFRHVQVRAEIDKGLAQLKKNAELRAEQKGVTLERWLDEVAALALSDVTDAFNPGVDGKLQMSLADLKKSGFGRLIRKLKVHPSGKVEFELHPKIPGLELLAKHYGWIKDQVEHSGGIATPQLPDGAIQKIFSDPKAMALARQLAQKMKPGQQGPGEGENNG